MRAAFRVGIKPAEFWRLTPHVTTLCIEAYNDAERDAREKDLWCEWHNAYLNRVDRMPPLSELTQPYRKEKPAEVEADKPGLDPVGRDLMNALMANFKPKFENKPKDGSEAANQVADQADALGNPPAGPPADSPATAPPDSE